MKKRLLVFTGAGVSAESGISTFRDVGGLWEDVDLKSICTVHGWSTNREVMQNFYNQRLKQIDSVVPNNAHLLIASLEEHFDVTVITQNVDDLHERAGSTNVIHLHGELRKKSSSLNKETHITEIPKGEIIKYGSKCPDGSAWRPYIVWFGEQVPNMSLAYDVLENTDMMLIVGTSLNVAPANLIPDVWGKEYYIIDPTTYVDYEPNRIHIYELATVGMEKFIELMKEKGEINV